MASDLSLLRDTPLTLMADFCNGYILHAVSIFRLWKSCFMSLLLWHCFLSFLWQWFPIIFSVHSETSTTYLFVMSLTKKIHVRWVACAALEHARKKRTIHVNVSMWKCESNFRKITDDCNVSDRREWLIQGKRIVCASSVPHRRWLEGKNLEKITESFKDGHKTFKVAASADWTEIIAAVVKMTRLTLHGPLL